MSAPIGVGDFVECIDAGPDRLGTPVVLEQGSIYQVERIWIDILDERDGSVGTGVDLYGIVDPRDYSFELKRFKPIYRPDASLIESLKTVSREQVLA